MSPDLPVAYVLPRFPQASQTFIAREIRGLRELGVPLLLFALDRLPASGLDERDQRWYGEIRFAPFALGWSVVGANIGVFFRQPSTYLRTVRTLLTLPHRPRIMVVRALGLMLIAGWVARQIERSGGCRLVHAHFALAQTEVAMAVSSLLSRPYSFTAHARDIYATPSALEEKIRGAAFVITCTGYNVDHLRSLSPDVPADRIRLVHHGVDIQAGAGTSGLLPSTGVRQPPLIVAAGRLIEKKGFDTLIDACALLLRRGLHFRCRIFGSGPLAGRLRARIDAANLGDFIELPGWLPGSALLHEIGGATVLAMPSRISDSGDRDGIPNVVLEAMASGVPVVATGVSGLPEAVSDGVTGLLVAPDNPTALADALHVLLADADLARSLGAAGAARARSDFSIEASTIRLARSFGFIARD